MTILGREAMGNIATAALTAILTVPITQLALAPTLDCAQGGADLAAGCRQYRSSGMGLCDQRNRLLALGSTGQPSAYPKKMVSHFFRSVNKAAASPTASPCASAASADVKSLFDLGRGAAAAPSALTRSEPDSHWHFAQPAANCPPAPSTDPVTGCRHSTLRH